MTDTPSKTLSEKFLDAIDSSFVGRSVAKLGRIVEETDPNRIYVENVRSFFHIPQWLARFACEVAVMEGRFEKRIGYLCPNDDCHRILIDVGPREDAPVEVCCEYCEASEKDKYCFGLDECRKIEFYRLKSGAVSHGHQKRG